MNEKTGKTQRSALRSKRVQKTRNKSKVKTNLRDRIQEHVACY